MSVVVYANARRATRLHRPMRASTPETTAIHQTT